MAADVEAQPREVELSALEAEKQPMAGGEAKNGLVKAAQGPGDESGAGPKFTGLGKEELLRAAASPAWARARTALLALFWLGWLAMLAAAAVIVARAPRCQAPLGAAWWKLGVLYRAPPEAFGGDLKGVQARLGHVAELGAGGLLLGPLHPPPEGGDPRAPPRLGELDPALGTEEELGGLLKAAREKGVQVVVELTPDPQGEAPWGSPELGAEPRFQQGLKDAVGRWLQRGVGGVFLDGIEGLQQSLVQELQNITEQHSPDGTPRLFLGGTRLQDPPALLQLLRASGGLRLLLGPFLQSLGGGPDPPGPNASHALLAYARAGPPLAWSLGTPWQRLPWLRPPRAPQLLLLLLAGLPGSPLLNAGDEMGGGSGTPGAQVTPIPWDVVEAAREGGNSSEARLLALCRRLGELRRQEPVLAMGGAQALEAGPVMALLREGVAEQEGVAETEGGANQEGVAETEGGANQEGGAQMEGGANQEGGAEPGGGAEAGGGAKRFLVLLNPGAEPARPTLDLQRLPPRARLVLSTHRAPPAPTEPPLELGQLQLEPYEGLLLALHEPTP